MSTFFLTILKMKKKMLWNEPIKNVKKIFHNAKSQSHVECLWLAIDETHQLHIVFVLLVPFNIFVVSEVVSQREHYHALAVHQNCFKILYLSFCDKFLFWMFKCQKYVIIGRLFDNFISSINYEFEAYWLKCLITNINKFLYFLCRLAFFLSCLASKELNWYMLLVVTGMARDSENSPIICRKSNCKQTWCIWF